MQLAGFAVGALAVEVVDAVGDVRRLLDFGDERAGADAVHASGGQEEEVAAAYFVFAQDLRHGVVRHAGLVFVGRHGACETRAQACAGRGIDHVPHLGLALRAVAAPGKRIVRVHLDREVLARVDELDEQRELLAEAGVDAVAHQRAFLARDQCGERRAGPGAVGHHRLVAPHAGQLPAFAYVRGTRGEALVGHDAVAAPERLFQNGFEFEQIHGSILLFYPVR